MMFLSLNWYIWDHILQFKKNVIWSSDIMIKGSSDVHEYQMFYGVNIVLERLRGLKQFKHQLSLLLIWRSWMGMVLEGLKKRED